MLAKWGTPTKPLCIFVCFQSLKFFVGCQSYKTVIKLKKSDRNALELKILLCETNAPACHGQVVENKLCMFIGLSFGEKF
jgi:hypothetical protein